MIEPRVMFERSVLENMSEKMHWKQFEKKCIGNKKINIMS